MSGASAAVARMAGRLSHRQRVLRLYRDMLKHSQSWCINRDQWREEALKIRQKFDENKTVFEPARKAALLEAAEAEFQANKHPDPYRPPTAVDGSKFERNVPPPPGVCKMTAEEESWYNDKRYWQ